jgi:hypothetical protein
MVVVVVIVVKDLLVFKSEGNFYVFLRDDNDVEDDEITSTYTYFIFNIIIVMILDKFNDSSCL